MVVREYAPLAARVGVGIVFLLLGIDQILNPGAWSGYVPAWVLHWPPGQTPEGFMAMNGVFNGLVGILLLLGVFTRVVAVLTVLHLLGVIATLGYDDVAIRDFGILLAALAVALWGSDHWCLDRWWTRRSEL